MFKPSMERFTSCPVTSDMLLSDKNLGLIISMGSYLARTWALTLLVLTLHDHFLIVFGHVLSCLVGVDKGIKMVRTDFGVATGM